MQGWCIEADLEGEYIKLKLYFMDMHSVPRNHLRYVSWFTFLSVLDPTSGQQESVPVKNSPHFSYYIQDALDMGVVISTSIPVADVRLFQFALFQFFNQANILKLFFLDKSFSKTIPRK